MERAQDWYAIEAPGQVERFAGWLTAAVQRIRDGPLLFPAVRQKVRRSHLNVLAHELWYLVHEDLQLGRGRGPCP